MFKENQKSLLELYLENVASIDVTFSITFLKTITKTQLKIQVRLSSLVPHTKQLC